MKGGGVERAERTRVRRGRERERDVNMCTHTHMQGTHARHTCKAHMQDRAGLESGRTLLLLDLELCKATLLLLQQLLLLLELLCPALEDFGLLSHHLLLV